MPAEISDAAFKLILDYEVGGGKQYYIRRLKRPTWPGGASGVTIGIGYDLGYNSPERFRADWHALSDETRDRLAKVCLAKGARASHLVRLVNSIEIPWDIALEVFRSSTVPRFMRMTLEAYPDADRLPPDAFGALVSLVFNRGNSLAGDRRREMLAIRDCVENGDLKGIAANIRKMKRLWVGKNLDGLLTRREAEAKLVEGAA